MPGAQSLNLDDTLLPLLERKRMVDAAWLVCLVATLGAVTVPWFLTILEIDLARAAWAVFAYAAAYLLVALATDRMSSMRMVRVAMRLMMLSSVVFLGALWRLVGALDNPMFLIAFTLPVIISGSLMIGYQAHLSAFVSVLTVTVIAVMESSELRWYLERLGLWPAMISDLVMFSEPWRGHVMAGVHTGPAYEFIVLETFAIMQFVVAFLSTPLAELLLRINARLEASSHLLTETQGLFQAVLSSAPEPAAIIYADSSQIVEASTSFFQRMLVRPSQLVGKGLFEVVHFLQPDRVRRALVGPHGEISFCAYRIGEEIRVANLSFHRTDHGGLSYVYLGWQELTELYYLQSAFDAMEDPLLVIGTSGRVHYANRTGQALFGELRFGDEVASVAPLQELVTRCTVDRKNTSAIRLQVGGHPYEVHALGTTFPGDMEAGTVIWLHSMQREDALFEQAVKDALTGIYNRRYFDDAIARHVERVKRGEKLAVAYFDMDGFKGINDQLGHAGGDAALIGFVQNVSRQLRESDIFARRGGDEFAVLFVDCELAVAKSAIDRVLASLATDGWTYEGVHRPLRSSVGLAASQDGDTPETLLERADRAVYAAKAAGKGQCVVAS